MKRVLTVVGVLFCMAVLVAAGPRAETGYITGRVAQFKKEAAVFAQSAEALKSAVSRLHTGDTASRTAAVEALRNCRLRYKRIEAFMEYFFEYPTNLYNRAPVYELEEPYMEYQSPVGLQYIESLLLEPNAGEHQKEIAAQCEVVASTAQDIPATLYKLEVSAAGILEANRLELIRISTLGITGYDAPGLKTGIIESAVALEAMSENLEPLLVAYPSSTTDTLRACLKRAITLLEAGPDFDAFDRLGFFTEAMLPLQEQLGNFIVAQNLERNTHPTLNYRARNIFSPDALDKNAFVQAAGRYTTSPELIALGKKLFSEKALSRNSSRSCATCHQPERAFTDGVVKSKALDEKTVVMRNAPSLYYAAYQHLQFYDGRAATLEAQLKAVLESPLEMDSNPDTIVRRLTAMPEYRQAFKTVFSNSLSIGLEQVSVALVAYEQTLAPFNSPFDRYLAGDAHALNATQKRGFNLFMGKAQCGSCHFAPVFNGLLPPYYERSELEVLGVPQRDAKGRQRADSDSGRYRFFPISFNNGAFKTTSVRNAGATAPYMHNGVFKNLKAVLDFYNKGGGRGLGLAVPGQTLSEEGPGLSRREVQEVIAFLRALEDKPAKPF
jgi:cytochrome c peroxidase